MTYPAASGREFASRYGHAFDGGDLAAGPVMPIAYLDEGGTSNPKQEPFLVVAGILLAPDQQYRAVTDELDALRERLPQHRQETAIFHAKDIYHGNKDFSREEWPDSTKRFELLEAIAKIPAKLGLEIMFGVIDRRTFLSQYDHNLDLHTQTIFAQAAATAMCSVRIERRMRDLSDNEVAHIVAEDQPTARKMVQATHEILKKPPSDFALLPWAHECLPLQRVVDVPFFAEKKQSAPLQIADMCAFVIRRAIMGLKDGEQLYNHIKPCTFDYQFVAPPDFNSWVGVLPEGLS